MTASLARPRLEMSLTCQNGPGAGAGVTGGRREGAARVWGSEGRGGRRKPAVRLVCRARGSWRPGPLTLPAPAWSPAEGWPSLRGT